MALNDADTRRQLQELEALNECNICGELARLTPLDVNGPGVCADCKPVPPGGFV